GTRPRGRRRTTCGQPPVGGDGHERGRVAPAPSPTSGLGERQPTGRRRGPERRAVAVAVPDRPGFRLEVPAPPVRRRVRLAGGPLGGRRPARARGLAGQTARQSTG